MVLNAVMQLQRETELSAVTRRAGLSGLCSGMGDDISLHYRAQSDVWGSIPGRSKRLFSTPQSPGWL
jgi:hypothetical protein